MIDAFKSSTCDCLLELKLHLSSSSPGRIPNEEPDLLQNRIMKLMRVISATWPSLKAFTVFYGDRYESIKMSPENLKEILELFQNLRKLGLENFMFRREPKIERQFPITSIKEFTLFELYDLNHLISILRAFPSLERLQFTPNRSGYLYFEKGIPCPSLESLEVDSLPDHYSIEEFKKILGWCFNLKKLKLIIDFSKADVLSTIASMINNCSQLEYIQLSNRYQGLHFNQILWSQCLTWNI